MRILHVTQGYYPAIGGTEHMIQRLSEELVRQFADQVTVFATNCYSAEAFSDPSLPRMPVGWEKVNGVSVRRFAVAARLSKLFRRPQDAAFRRNVPLNEYLRAIAQGPIVPGLKRAIRGFPADIIGASSFPLLHMYTSLAAARRTGRPCVLIGGLHPEDAWGYERKMIYRAIRRATRYVAYTEYEAAHVISRGADPNRVHTIGLGVDAERFAGLSQAEAKRGIGVQSETPVVGFIGQLGSHKGVDTLLLAMPEVWRVVPDAHLLLAGARTLFAQKLEQTVSGWPPQQRQRVIFCFDFPEERKPRLFTALDVLAYPSGFESFGLSFLEAWAAGKPVIGCRRDAVPSVVHEGHDGLLVNYQDPGALSAAIVDLLQNRDKARSLGEVGRRKVMERHTWSKVAKSFRDVYTAALREA